MRRTAAALALGLTATHALLFLALHLFERELDVRSSIISDYLATGSRGVATAAFVVFAGLWASLAAALPGGSRFTTAGRLLFLLAAVFMLVAIAFPSSADPRTGSVLSTVQNLFARPGLFVGVLLVSVGLARNPAWSALAKILVGLSLTALAMLVVAIGLLLERDLGGVGQRVVFLLLYAWSALVAGRLLGASG